MKNLAERAPGRRWLSFIVSIASCSSSTLLSRKASCDSRPSMLNTDLCSGAVLRIHSRGQPIGCALPTDEREGDRMFRWKGR
jgi:hypothetical protein